MKRKTPARRGLKEALAPLAVAALVLAPRWAARPEEPQRKPSFLVILADDMGFSDAGSYGGEIETPNLDRLAARGLRFSKFYNTARCWPTRSALLTGYYPQQIRMDPPQGRLPEWARLLPRYLKPLGYRSYHCGKWHVFGAPKAVADGGFDHSYKLDDQDRHFSPRTHFEDDRPLEPVQPGSGYYATVAIADHAIRCLKEHAEKHAGEPFFLYLAFTSPHFPLHALAGDIERYRDRYLVGWDAIRERRWKRLRERGIVDCALPPLDRKLTPRYFVEDLLEKIGPGEIRRAVPWEDLTEDQKRLQATKMAIHAAMVDRMDREIGRVLDQLRSMGSLDDTAVFFLSDNGADATLLVRGDGHDRGAAPGSSSSFLCLGPGWASASNAPFRRHKIWVHEGGIATPFIVSWPRGIAARGEIRHWVGHVIDIAPTLLELAGERSLAIPGGAPPLPGRSLVPAFVRDGAVEPAGAVDRGGAVERGGAVVRDFLFFHHEGNRALRVGRWKIVSAREDGGAWELYDMAVDRCEMVDLAQREPDRARRMAERWAELEAQFRGEAGPAKEPSTPGTPRSQAPRSDGPRSDAKPSGAPPTPDTLRQWDTLCAAGDTMIARWQHDLVARHGVRWPLEGVAGVLSAADASLCNLECCVSLGGLPADKGERCPFHYRARPEMLRSLTAAGIDIVTAANNHVGDYGPSGVAETLRWTGEAGLVCAGIGQNSEEAERPRLVRVGRTRVAVCGLDTTMPRFAASVREPGSSFAEAKGNPGDLAAFAEKTRRLAAWARGRSDLLVLTVHWGDNWAREVPPLHREMARIAFENGVDLILGHSAHRLQGIEVVGGKVVLYDMGNLLFDCLLQEEGRRSALFRIHLSPGGVHRVDVIPASVLEGRTTLASSEDAAAILEELRALCAPLGTALKVERDPTGRPVGVLEVPGPAAVPRAVEATVAPGADEAPPSVSSPQRLSPAQLTAKPNSAQERKPEPERPPDLEREPDSQSDPGLAVLPQTREFSAPRSEASLRSGVPEGLVSSKGLPEEGPVQGGPAQEGAARLDPPVEIAPGVELLAFRLPKAAPEGGVLTVATWWRTTRPVEEHWLVGIEIATAGKVQRRGTAWYTRHDPGDWSLPFSRMRPGEIVEDLYPARLQGLPAGVCEVRAVILDPAVIVDPAAKSDPAAIPDPAAKSDRNLVPEPAAASGQPAVLDPVRSEARRFLREPVLLGRFSIEARGR